MEKEKRAKEQEEKDRMNSMSPADFMRQLTLDDGSNKPKYTKFDEGGMPTHDAKGEEMVKSALKKASKEFNGQQKKFDKVKNKKA